MDVLQSLRLVYNDCRSSFDEILRKDKSISIHHRNIHNIAIVMFKVKHKLSPPLMNEIFEQNSNGRATRMGDKFTRPTVKILRSFGPIVWNTMLPKELKECSSLAEFKNSIESWIPNNCPCRLCKPY